MLLLELDFNPDWTWIKNRDQTDDHKTFDAVRGVTKVLKTNTTGAESTDSNTLTAFGTDGFTVGTDGGVNGSGENLVAWNWLAGGTASSNTDGSITSSVSVNTTAGFSIVKYTGNNTAGATVGHGLGAVPKVMIMKELGGTNGWHVYHHSIGNNAVLVLDQNASNYSPNNFLNSTNPTSSIFTLGQNGGSNATTGMIAYCFAEKTGYSKFGSYTGNGNADGTFIYTGFKPAWLMIKKSSATENWLLLDNKRDIDNTVQNTLLANTNNSEFTGTDRVDFLSNGFKCRTATGGLNDSGTFIYMAFAEEPLVANVGQSIPATAR